MYRSVLKSSCLIRIGTFGFRFYPLLFEPVLKRLGFSYLLWCGGMFFYPFCIFVAVCRRELIFPFFCFLRSCKVGSFIFGL